MSDNGEILIVKNITREGPGLIGDLLKEFGIKNRINDLSRGEKPGNIEMYSAVIVLGGPASANDDTPEMKYELAMIRKVLAAGVPYLGICLGLQALVKASGGQVVKHPVNEVGFRDQNNDFYNVELTKTGRNDPLFDGIADTFNVFQLHGETVTLTNSIDLLAKGKYCTNQIVKTGTNAYGIQSHLELTEEMLEIWMSEDSDLNKLDREKLWSDFLSLGSGYKQTGRRLLLNFFRTAGFMV
jgi:GMP synthase (glutamine-hydrolysing)